MKRMLSIQVQGISPSPFFFGWMLCVNVGASHSFCWSFFFKATRAHAEQAQARLLTSSPLHTPPLLLHLTTSLYIKALHHHGNGEPPAYIIPNHLLILSIRSPLPQAQSDPRKELALGSCICFLQSS